jgi:hypothetical protein
VGAVGGGGLGQVRAVGGVVGADAGDDPGPTASTTARRSRLFSASVVVGDSPVVPEMTSPSQPASTSRVASRAAASVSSDPSGLNGVAMAVRTVPSRALASKPLVLTDS